MPDNGTEAEAMRSIAISIDHRDRLNVLADNQKPRATQRSMMEHLIDEAFKASGLDDPHPQPAEAGRGAS